MLTTSGAGTSESAAALELVPTETVGDTAAPSLDGVVEDGEYAAEIDLSRRWEGTACTDAADCSATGWITRSGDALYVAAEVTDDTLGTVLAAERLQAALAGGLPRAGDRPDRHVGEHLDDLQGGRPAHHHRREWRARRATPTTGRARSARSSRSVVGARPLAPPTTPRPGFEAVSRLNEPYTGYVIETKIPFSVLPATVDPDRMGFNAFVYDSDTQDKTGQTRLGWSTFGGVQGDPYRWGRVVLEGDAPPAVATSEPRLDFPALSSLESPPSIAQAVRTGVALSGLPQTPERVSAEVVRVVPRDGAVARVRGVARVAVRRTSSRCTATRSWGSRVVDVGPGTHPGPHPDLRATPAGGC